MKRYDIEGIFIDALIWVEDTFEVVVQALVLCFKVMFLVGVVFALCTVAACISHSVLRLLIW